MNDYSIALVLHVAGALGVVAMLGLEWTGLWLIRSAPSAGRVRDWMKRLKSGRKIAIASMLTTGLSGSYMMMTHWGPVAWSVASVGSLALMIVLTLAVTGPRMKAIGRALAGGGGRDAQVLRTLAGHPLLWVSVQTRLAVVVGSVLLKVVKPGLGGSLLMVGAAIAIGVVSALPMPAFTRQDRLPAATTHNI